MSRRVWSRQTKRSRWHPYREHAVAATASALELAVPNLSDKVRWWLVEDTDGKLYEFRNTGQRFEALNWPKEDA